MRRGDKKVEPEQDDKAQSRLGLKNKLYNIGGGDFDLSVFTDSNNDPQKFSSMFPQFNEPTLEDSQPGQNMKLVEDNSLQQYYGEGITARNSSNKSKVNQSAFLELELTIDELRHQLKLKQSELNKYKKTNEILQLQMNEMQKEQERKDKKIQKQQLQITLMRQRQTLASEYSSKQSSQCKSMLSQGLNDFCPEMLSPQQTVDLLTQLLRKVSKSHRMTKTMIKDEAIKQLLSKMHRG